MEVGSGRWQSNAPFAFKCSICNCDAYFILGFIIFHLVTLHHTKYLARNQIKKKMQSNLGWIPSKCFKNSVYAVVSVDQRERCAANCDEEPGIPTPHWEPPPASRPACVRDVQRLELPFHIPSEPTGTPGSLEQVVSDYWNTQQQKKTTKNKTNGRFRNKLYERKKKEKKNHTV